jgi:hypothetical protein
VSGYYTAPVKLDERATALVTSRVSLERARSSVEATMAALAQALAEVVSGQVSTPEMGAVRLEVLRAMEDYRVWLDRVRLRLTSMHVPDRYQQTTLSELRGMQADLAEMEEGIAQAGEQAASGFARFQRAVGADERLVAARTSLGHAHQELRAAGSLLRDWLPARYDDLTTRLSSAQGMAAELGGLRDEQAVAGAAEKLEADTSALVSAVTEAAAEATDRRARIGQRDYLLASLVSVCQDLGFERAADPDTGEADVVALRFDTIDRGIIDFRIGLDGRIVTDSAIDPAYCAEQFDQLGEALTQEYGLATTFTALQDEDTRPRSNTFEAAEEPGRGTRSLGDPE